MIVNSTPLRIFSRIHLGIARLVMNTTIGHDTNHRVYARKKRVKKMAFVGLDERV